MPGHFDSDVEVKNLLAVRNDGLSKLLLTVAAVALGIGILLFGAGFLIEHHHSSTWNPLGPYTLPQQVTNGPVIKWDTTVNVQSVKCAKEPVMVHGASSWESVGATGTDVLSAVGVSNYAQGCVIKRFEHLIPPEVVRLAEAGITRWEIAGTDTPYRSNGRQGVSQSWTTETFTLEKP